MRLCQVILIVSLFLLSYNPKVLPQDYYPQDQKVLVFDPNGVSGSFQYSFSQLSNDSVFIADTIDENINNFDALFLFIDYPFILSQEEGYKLIEFTGNRKPIYIYTELGAQNIDTVAFWNYIGVTGIAWLTLLVHVDFIEGIDTMFTKNILIDTSFISGSIPVVFGDVVPVLIGVTQEGVPLTTTYISTKDSISIVLDLYNLIYRPEFLERVIEHFNLNLKQPLIQFHPVTDTAYIQGGCTAPEIICKNLSSTAKRDSILIEPGFNTGFMYYDSLANPVYTDNFYFTVIDSLNEFKYELWLHPKAFPPYDPVLIPFDTTFYIYQNDFDIQLIAKRNGVAVDSFLQPFHADYGLEVEDGGLLPKEFSLYQNYPNPFNPTTKISWQSPVGSWQTLKVYDVLGNEIATLVNEKKLAGSYEVEFSANGEGRDLPSGVYFYQLKAANFVETKKMLLVK